MLHVGGEFSVPSSFSITRFACFEVSKQRDTDEAQAVPQALFQTVPLLVNRYQQVADERCQNLNAHRVFCAAQELLDLQMLLDPFEEKFDCPAFLVALGDLRCARREVVRRQYKGRWFVRAHHRDTAKRFVEVLIDTPLAKVLALEFDDLVV